MSELFASGGQTIGVSASTSVLQMNIRDWFPLGLVGSPCSPRTLRSLLQHHSSKASILQWSAFFMVQFSHPYMTTGETGECEEAAQSTLHDCIWTDTCHLCIQSSYKVTYQKIHVPLRNWEQGTGQGSVWSLRCYGLSQKAQSSGTNK